MVADGTAPRVPQTEEGATYDPIVKKGSVQVDWSLPSQDIHNFIRGSDKVPGAWTIIGGEVSM